MNETAANSSWEGAHSRRQFGLPLAIIVLAILLAPAVQATTFHVTTNADNGDNNNPMPGSLRNAIKDANANPGLDTIDFNIPAKGVQTIALQAQLMIITDPVVIDGYTQPGAHANTLATGDDAVVLIELDGTLVPQPASGLYILAGGCTVKGLIITNFSPGGSGISLVGQGNNLITGNFIGTPGSAGAKTGNDYGIYLASPGNTIGGLTPAERNVISGNVFEGIRASDPAVTNTRIQGNFIGTDSSGAAPLGNLLGIAFDSLGSAASNNLIGGSSPGSGNVISGNEGSGVVVTESSGISVQGNLIGTDATGKLAVGNVNGIFILGNAPGPATIGGNTAGARNVISGNGHSGIIVDQSASGVIISGNYIGTDLTGNVALPNSAYGIECAGSNSIIGSSSAGPGNVISANAVSGVRIRGLKAIGNVVLANSIGYGADGVTALGNQGDGILVFEGAGNNVIGSLTEPNFIAFNTLSGIAVIEGTGNRISSNSIRANGGLGIDLSNDGVTPNDPGDGDSGGNNFQNYPSITSVTSNGGNSMIQGILSSTPNTQFALEFFAGAQPDPSGFGEGQTLIGSVNVTTNANGDATFNPTFPFTGQYITATATDPAGNTSEFSLAVKVNAPAPALSINDVSKTEGNGGQTSANFTVTLSAVVSVPVTVNYATANGTATAPGDYAAKSGSVTFDVGETTKPISISINGDTQFEPDETFFVNLSNAVNATISKAQGLGTILNDDNQPASLQFNQAAYTTTEGQGTVTITVTRTGGVIGATSIQYATVAGGTATASSDYTPVSGTLNWADGDAADKTFTVAVTDDSLDEANETVNITLSNPTGGAILGSPSSATVTITDNDPTPSLSIADVSQTEGNSGVTNFNFTVTLSAPSGQTVSVNYATADGSALSGNDYQPASGTLTFTPGQTTKQVQVLVNGDPQNEIDETFLVTLTNPVNATTAKAQGLGTILNDDNVPALPTVQFNQSNYATQEDAGTITITVTRSGDTSGSATIDYRTTDTDTFTVNCAAKNGAAFGRCDFATVAGTLNFAAGDTSKTFKVPIINDAYAEGTETFSVVLSNPSGATLGATATATISILDNETVDGTNPILLTNNAGVGFFVRQHYLDFLGREPEPGEPWSNILQNCADQFNTNPGSASAGCDRITVSGSFFGSPEFKDKGVYLIDFYRVAFNRLPHYPEFPVDLASITGATAAEANARRAAFAANFVQRPEFTSTYGAMTNSAYVNALMNGGLGQGYNLISIVTPDPLNPDGPTKITLTTNDLINGLNGGTLTKAQVLRAIVQSDQISLALEVVNAFVASQYYGYLRREPDAVGFNGWVTYLKNNPNDFRTMVHGFVDSTEYRSRFGP